MRKTFSLILFIFFLGGCDKIKKLEDVKLVVVISVDQLSYDLLTKNKPLYTGGFKWLIDHGYQFTNTHHEHGYTATGPGHFVIGSGQHPGPNGILGNYWYNRDLGRSVSCVEDTVSSVVKYEGNARSYRQINTTGLGDWVKEKYPNSKIYSVAGKDRAAVMLAGKHPDMAFYYNWRGQFVTSDYYMDTLPDWLIAYNNDLQIVTYRDSLWTRSLSPPVYDEYGHADFFEGESDRYHSVTYSPIFPIGFDEDLSDEDIADDFFGFPWMERATINLAKVIVDEEELGKDLNPDILFVGLSATDAIVHYYGPNSHEAIDNLIKADQYLGSMIQFIHTRVDSTNVLFILTGDHGGLPLPEHRQTMGLSGGRINKTERKDAVKESLKLVTEKFGRNDLLVNDGLGFYYDVPLMNELNIAKTEVDEIIISRMEKVGGVAKVLTKDEIMSSAANDRILRRLRNSFHSDKSADLWVLQEKYWVTKYPYGTGHGTPYDYDTHVPLIFSNTKFSKKMFDDRTATVDIAPTIANILGVIPDRTDGNVLRLGKRVKR